MASSVVANARAGFLLFVREKCGQRPHVSFEWMENIPVEAAGRFLL